MLYAHHLYYSERSFRRGNQGWRFVSFSLLFYVFEAALEVGPGKILQMTQKIIVAKFNLLSRCELD